MSADAPGRREVAYRLFADEYDDATLSYSESDEERAPNYVVTPTGARVNRLFVVGVLTEVTQVGDDILRARVSDPTGVFVLYAGQYQPDEQAFLERTDPPAFVAVTGKARTFQPDDSDQVYTSIRPESINLVDAATRDRWLVQTAEQTLERVGHAARALASGASGDDLREELSGIDPALADGIPRALAQYGTTAAYLERVRTMALDVARVVAGERDEVRGLVTAPDESGDVTTADVLDAVPAVTTADAVSAEPTETEPAVSTESESTEDLMTGDSMDNDVTGDSTAKSSDDVTSELTDDDVTDDPTDDDVIADTVGETDSEETEPAAETDDPGEFDPEEFDPEEFDLDEDTREEIESEYGTDFQSGSEVDDPGEADIETPGIESADENDAVGERAESETAESDAGELDAGEAESETAESDAEKLDTSASDDSESESDTAVADETDDQATETETEIDPQEAVLTVMTELDEDDGADREAVIAETSERYGLSEDEVTDAIQNALMDGRCYEPTDSSLKPI